MTVSANQQHEDMDLDEQERLFFAQMGPIKRESQTPGSEAPPVPLNTAKRQRLDQQDKGKGKGGKGKGKAKGKGSSAPSTGAYSNGFDRALNNPWPSDRGQLTLGGEPKWESSGMNYYDRQERLEGMENRVQRLTQLALRQEQLLANLRQDMMLYLFVRSGDAGLIPVLCQSADRWRQLKEEGKINMSLKLAMFKQLLVSLQERLAETAKDSKAMDHAQSLGWLDKAMEGTPLEPSSAAPRRRGESKACLHFGSDCTNPPSPKGGYRGFPASLQVPSQAQPGCESRLDTISDGHQPSSGSVTIVGDIEVLDRPVLMAHARLSTAQGAASSRCPRRGSVELLKGVALSLKALLQVALQNSSQLCYLNSTAYALTWTVLQAQLHGANDLNQVMALKALCKPRLSSALPLKLLAQLPWATLLQGWTQVHQQHDAPELVTYLLPRLGIHRAAGRWEARWNVNHCVTVFDHGTLLAPIIMALPPGEQLHLQQVITLWHTQARLHALSAAPDFLCVQLNRFSEDNGELCRDTRPLQGTDNVIYFPVFTATDTLQTHPIPFQVTSAQLHFGERPTSGHYRAILQGQKELGAAQLWITDDNTIPQSASHTHCDAIYLLWLRQVRDHDS